MEKLTSKWGKTASGYDRYEIADGGPELVFQLAPLLQQHFGLTPRQAPIDTLDEAFIKYENFDIDWDIWMGFSVCATTEEGNHLVHQIATYLETRLDLLQR